MMEEDKDEIIIKGIKESLDSVEEINVKVPDMGFFRNMVAKVEEKKQKKKRKETFVFLLSAIAFLSFETYACSQSIIYFMVFQAIALISIPVALLLGFKRKKSMREHSGETDN